MRSLALLRSKKRLDQALNLTELSVLSGYRRVALAAMELPLIEGKITYSDFRRVLRRRQDAHEKKFVRPPQVLPSPSATDSRLQTIADKFDAPSPRHGGRAASRLRGESPLRSTGK